MQTDERSRLERLVPVAIAFLLTTAYGFAGTVVSCPFSGVGGDIVARGIVVPNYPGNNIRRLKIGYGASTAGEYRITAQIRRGSFDGPIVGTSSIFLSFPGGSYANVYGFFHFGGAFDGAPVTPGDTLAIIQTYSGPGPLVFDVGNDTSCGGVVHETEGTTPPLDTFRRDTVGIDIDQDDLTGACIPSDTVLCVDNNPGDRRFKLTMDFSHAGSPPTSAQAISGATIGITHGGTFWFFSQDNPEMLVKVLPACAVNNKFWVFASAGTNVGFNLRILDTLSSVTKTYSNLDNVPAVPVQDTSAFACP